MINVTQCNHQSNLSKERWEKVKNTEEVISPSYLDTTIFNNQHTIKISNFDDFVMPHIPNSILK